MMSLKRRRPHGCSQVAVIKTAARSIAYYDTESTHLSFRFETQIRTLLNVLLDLVFVFDVFFFSLLGSHAGCHWDAYLNGYYCSTFCLISKDFKSFTDSQIMK